MLWKDAPYTWSKAISTVDLYEGAVDFRIKVLPCAGGGNVNISYTLLLDLDNDNLRESAVSSLNFPPAGIMYADNAFNPGYTGGDPVEFDKRPVPDSLKYRFALNISTSWDTLIAHLCWQSGSAFISSRLPEGRHHLIWRVEQDGVVKYCEHSFLVKDCQAPTLECPPNWSISLDASGTATLFWNDILPDANDNVTPFSQLEFSMRKSDGTTGFPLDSTGQIVSALTYDCEELDSQLVELWAKDRLSNAGHCTIYLSVNDEDGFCEKPPLLCARTFWNGDLVTPVEFKMLWVDTAQKLIVHPLPSQLGGCGMLNFLPPANTFSLVAESDMNPLNGVSTFDLLLISRHILGLQPFDAPWKWFAADVNKSNSVTTFDVVEIRKLILGIYDKFPQVKSWRFFPAGCDFQPNPFATFCPPEYSFITTPLWNYPPEIPFDALKTGDVNASASVSFDANEADSRAQPVSLGLPDLLLRAGEFYDLSLQISEPGDWLGLQFAMQFDPKIVEIEVVHPGNLPGLDENSFAQPLPGVLHFSWFSPEPQVIFPEENVLSLRAKALQSATLQEVVQLKNERLTAEIYTSGAAIRPLQLIFEKNERQSGTVVFQPQPNPTTAGVRIPVWLARSEKICLEVVDFSGKTIFQTERVFESGSQILEIPATVFPATGLYGWRACAGEVVQSGKIVRQ
ncbi:MAG: hypothetical protein OHK0019_17300 [Saprospiraceae bacterium]